VSSAIRNVHHEPAPMVLDGAATVVAPSGRSRWRRRLAPPLAVLAAGIALVFVGALADTDLVRWALIAVGLYLCLRVTDQLGRRRWGAEFRTSSFLCLAWVVMLLAATSVADLLPLDAPRALPLDSPALLAPKLVSSHPLGTDNFGRDYLARVIFGARASLAIGVGAVLVGVLVGGFIGAVAGFFRGKTEAVVNAVTDFMLAFPPLVMLLALVAILRPGARSAFIGLTALTIPAFVRVAKASSVSYSNREFVLVARVLGAKRRHVLLHDLLPNVAYPVLSYGMVILPTLIVAEAGLSFLGLSVRPPYPTWGNMIAEAQPIFQDHPHTVLVPGLAIFATVFSLNRLGSMARARWDRTS
jgi:peptide/nickel transport system permease protein